MMRYLGLLLLSIMLLFTQVPLPSLQAQESGSCARSHVIQSGESLSIIAGRLLGDPLAYPSIVEATRIVALSDPTFNPIVDVNRVGAGWKLCVELSTSSPGATSTPNPTSPAATPTAVSLSVPTATETPPSALLHPLRIDRLREDSYPGSDLVIEQTLSSGANYRRYVASYLSEGFRIDGLLTVPVGEIPEGGWPVIIFNHGYIPPQIYRTTQRYVAYVDGFARNGYIVFKPDYRGHGFSEGEPASGSASPDYTIDVLNAVASLARYPQADPDRIGMWGHSMGGGITLRTMVVTDTVKAGSIWAGVVISFLDLAREELLQEAPLPTWMAEPWQALEEEYGTVEQNPAFYRAIAANHFLTDLSGPIQIQHATGDSSVPVAYADVLANQAEAADADVEYFRYVGDNHNLSVNFGVAMARAVAFFDRHLKPGASAQP